MSDVLKRCLAAACIATVVSACATREYTASSPMVQVGPSKGWYKPGIDGKEAFLTWRQCIDDAKKEPGYLALKRDASTVTIASDMSKADEKRAWAPNVYVGEYSNRCMAQKGFKYMKYPAGEQVYVPPRPPEKGWMKPGVSYADALSAKSKCLDSEYSQEYLDKCMAEQGFTYGVLEDELR